MRNKILFIAPLPPPVNGHSLMSQYTKEILEDEYEIIPINLSKSKMEEGSIYLLRIKEVINIFIQIFKNRSVDKIYLTISESIAGNIKDIIIYLLLFNKLDRMILHLHGGSLKRNVLEKSIFLKLINHIFLKKISRVIVLGQSHVEIFRNILPKEKIEVIPNFIPNNFFIDENDLNSKFKKPETINLLYLSNMVPKKGFQFLLDSYLTLQPNIRNNFKLFFAGRFDTEDEKLQFLEKIQTNSDIHYLGEVSGNEKIKIFHQSHIFILPSFFFEGQPMAILESFASGCVNIVTSRPGILDIFSREESGYIVVDNSVESFHKIFEEIIDDKEKLVDKAQYNYYRCKQNYTIEKYSNKINRIFK